MKDKKIQIIEWLVDFQGEPPKCCYTCLHYSRDQCSKFKTSPPDDFKLEIDKCKEYTVNVPF